MARTDSLWLFFQVTNVPPFAARGTFIRAYYYSNYFGSQTSYFTISFIGSLNNMALTGGALIVSPFLAHYGPQIIIFASTILQGIALILASFSTAAWATLLTQGLLFGIGEIGVYLAVVHIVQQYFLKKKGLALGLAVSGSGFGGLCMSSVSQILIDKTGFAWSLRILAFMILGVGLGAGLLMRPRVTPAYKKAKAGEKIKRPPVFVWKAFKNPYFTVLFISSGISIFGYFVPFIILPSYAYSVGISTSLASLSLGVLNGASAIGRIAIGILGDKIGYVNSFLVVQFGCPIIVLVLWPFAKSLGLVMLTAALYGFFAGGVSP